MDPVYLPRHRIIGDIANAIRQLSERVGPSARWDTRWSADARELCDLLAVADGDPLFELRVTRVAGSQAVTGTHRMEAAR